MRKQVTNMRTTWHLWDSWQLSLTTQEFNNHKTSYMWQEEDKRDQYQTEFMAGVP